MRAAHGGPGSCLSRAAGGVRQLAVAVKLDQIGNEQEQPAHPGGELSFGEDEVLDVGYGFDGRSDAEGTFFTTASRQGSKALCGKNLANSRGTERGSGFLERPADVVDGVIALT